MGIELGALDHKPQPLIIEPSLTPIYAHITTYTGHTITHSAYHTTEMSGIVPIIEAMLSVNVWWELLVLKPDNFIHLLPPMKFIATT